jgi:diadenosine tetraphosphate (Ap4A) HIT family hydrolase
VIAGGLQPASVVAEDKLTLAFVDLRQFHPGHVLVIPKHHFPDIRELDVETLYRDEIDWSHAQKADDAAKADGQVRALIKQSTHGDGPGGYGLAMPSRLTPVWLR